MPYFTHLKAPDLSDINNKTLLERTIHGLFQGSQPPADQKGCRLLFCFLINTDKAIREYEAGRETLIKYSTSTNKIALMIEGVGRMETCINSIKQAFRFWDRLV